MKLHLMRWQTKFYLIGSKKDNSKTRNNHFQLLKACHAVESVQDIEPQKRLERQDTNLVRNVALHVKFS